MNIGQQNYQAGNSTNPLYTAPFGQKNTYGLPTEQLGDNQYKASEDTGEPVKTVQEMFEANKIANRNKLGDTINQVGSVAMNLLPFAFKDSEIQQRRTANIINPITGLPYEQMTKAENNITSSLNQAVRNNKTTDALTNATINNNAMSKATDQRNDLQAKNAGVIADERNRFTGQLNAEQKEADAFYNEGEIRKGQAQDAKNLKYQTVIGNTAKGIQDAYLHSQNKKEQNRQQQIALTSKQLGRQYDSDAEKWREESVRFGNLATQKQAELNQARLDPEKNAELIKKLESEYNAYKQSYENAGKEYSAINSKSAKSYADLEAMAYGVTNKGYKKGGSLTFEDRVNLENQKHSNKMELEQIKQKAKSIESDLKALEKKRNSKKDTSYADNMKIIMEFYKSLKNK